MNPRILPWQQNTLARQLEQYQLQQLPHAILFYGQQGAGGEQLLAALASSLICEKHQVNGCGQCKACMLRSAGSHPDVIAIQPDEPGKALKVDQIRVIRDFSAQTAQQGGVKVITIQPADAMNVNAANALLKVLEEPTKETFLLLSTERLDAVLPTIRSRCRLQKLPQPDPEAALDWLRQQHTDLSVEALQQRLKLSMGSPMLALNLVDSQRWTIREQMISDLEELMKQVLGPVELSQRWQKYEAVDIFYWLVIWFTDLARFVGSKGETELTDAEAAKLLKFTASKCDALSLFGFTDHLQQVRAGILEQKNLNNQLVLEEVLIRWQQLLQSR